MKAIFKLLLIICLLSSSSVLRGQKTLVDFYPEIKKYDVAQLWHNDSLKMEGSGETMAFPKPLGFIGNNYQRFNIHYTFVVKDKRQPYLYKVSGKTMVNNTIRSFTGTITVRKAYLLNGAFAVKNKQGELIADIYLLEDKKQNGSGYIQGEMKTNWHIDKDGKIVYDTINCVSDNFSNNQFTGTRTNNITGEKEKCNWGDFRIPQSGDLDTGTGEFNVNTKYLKNGWQSYQDVNSNDKKIAAKAKATENSNWWN